MRRQRYPHTVPALSEGLRSRQDEDTSTFESLSTQQQQQSDSSWTQHNLDFASSQSSSRLFSMDQQRSFTGLGAFQLVNDYGCAGEPYAQGFIPGFFDNNNVDYINYATGELTDYPYLHRFPGSQRNGPIEAGDDSQLGPRSSLDSSVANTPPSYPALSTSGTVFLVLRNCIVVHINAEKAVYVTNYPGKCVGVMNGTGDKCCVIHPNGKVLQDGTTIHMETGNKAAKICKKGIIFSSTDHSLAYLVDASGTKSTSERFRELSPNIATNMFRSGNPNSQEAINICCNMVSETSYRRYNNGDEAWIIGGIRIKLNSWGEVRVTTNCGRRVLKTSPAIQSMFISTPFFFAEVCCNPFRYFIVRRGDKTVCCGSTGGMLVQNGSQKAGFNRVGRLVLY